MPELIVSLDHVAVLRDKRRKGNEPDPVAAAVIAEMAGADGIAVSLRGDRKHIQDRDVRVLREIVKTRLHLALAPVSESVKLAYAVKPDYVTLVPERHDEVSSSLGLDVILNQAHIKKVVRALREVGVRVTILVDPEADQVTAAQITEADAVLLNARLYADSAREREARDELERIEGAARIASKRGLKVYAGHGLDYATAAAVARLSDVHGLEMGHAIVSRALFSGFERAVGDLRRLLRGG